MRKYHPLSIYRHTALKLDHLITEDPKSTAALCFGMATFFENAGYLPTMVSSCLVAGVVAVGTHSVLEVIEGRKPPHRPDVQNASIKNVTPTDPS